MKVTHYSAPDPDPEGRALVSLETERGAGRGPRAQRLVFPG